MTTPTGVVMLDTNILVHLARGKAAGRKIDGMGEWTIIGIDAATKPRKTGLALGRHDGERVKVEVVRLGEDATSLPQEIAAWIRPPTLLAIDAPLGWPTELAARLSAHRAGAEVEGEAEPMFIRLTDRIVRERVGKKPLSVGADLIARTAFAALRLLGDVRRAAGLPIPMRWGGGLTAEVAAVEVYPAATLIARGIAIKGYKADSTDGTAARAKILSALDREVDLADSARAAVTRSDDMLDALVCVLAGADVLRGAALAPTEEQLVVAKGESWIWFKPPGE